MAMSRLGIITAMPTEVWPLIRDWKRQDVTLNGRMYRFYERDSATVLCGGIGHAAGTRATEAMLEHVNPDALFAVGLCGGLHNGFKLGDIMFPATILSEDSSERFSTVRGEGTVVSSCEIAGAAKKKELAQRFAADIVDMEGAAVGKVAKTHGVALYAVKSLSDELEYDLPPLQPFVNAEGKFEAARFTMHAAIHPTWWPKIADLKRRSDVAARSLAAALEKLIATFEATGNIQIPVRSAKA
jgi:adenosylhomocysteine nucleosidase